MYPAKPPLPVPRNLPFQPVSGIHTSILMSESFAGFSVACTRQKAGRFLGLNIVPGSETPAGRVKAPAATCCADVMVVSGSLSVARLSQVAAKAGLAIAESSRRKSRHLRFKRPPKKCSAGRFHRLASRSIAALTRDCQNQRLAIRSECGPFHPALIARQERTFLTGNPSVLLLSSSFAPVKAEAECHDGKRNNLRITAGHGRGSGGRTGAVYRACGPAGAVHQLFAL